MDALVPEWGAACLKQPVGKQYSFGEGPEFETEMEKLQTENCFLKQQIDVLKKYAELERKWFRE